MTADPATTDHADRGPGGERVASAAPSWNGKPPSHAKEGWHLLRRRAKGFPGHGREEPWLYVPGASYPYNGPEITPWHSVGHGVEDELHIAWGWEYVGRLILEQGPRNPNPVVPARQIPQDQSSAAASFPAQGGRDGNL